MSTLSLVLNSAEKRVQFLVLRGRDMLCAQDWLCRTGSTELLAPVMHDAFTRMGISPLNLDRIACVAGPGSFTGLRLALTTAAALARTASAYHGSPVRQAGLDYLQCLAANAPAKPGERIRVAINAKRGWIYQADYIAQNPGEYSLPQPPRRTGDIRMIPLPQENDAPEEGIAWILGSAVHSEQPGRAELFTRLLPGARLLDTEHPFPASLLAAALAAPWDDGATLEDIQPLYLREPDAIDNLDTLSRAQGRDPGQARAELDRLLRQDI